MSVAQLVSELTTNSSAPLAIQQALQKRPDLLWAVLTFPASRKRLKKEMDATKPDFTGGSPGKPELRRFVLSLCKVASKTLGEDATVEQRFVWVASVVNSWPFAGVFDAITPGMVRHMVYDKRQSE
jgi:hypothetical protein